MIKAKALTITVILGTSFIVGNLVSFYMGAFPINYSLVPYSIEEKNSIQELKHELTILPNEPGILTELGVLYFLHNELENAESNLSKAKAISPENAEILSWYSANQAKLSNQRLDLLFGYRKLAQLNYAIKGLNEAVENDPTNVINRLNRLIVFSYLKPTAERIHTANQDILWFESMDKQQFKNLPYLIQAHFYKAYIVIKSFSFMSSEDNKSNEYKLALDGLIEKKPEILKFFNEDIRSRYD